MFDALAGGTGVALAALLGGPPAVVARGSAANLPAGLTYTGASGKYFVDAGGVYRLLPTGQLRSQHVAVLGASPALLIEPAGTNVLTSPQDLSASWTLSNVTPG